MPKQTFTITRPPEQPPVSTEELKSYLYNKHTEAEWEVKEQTELSDLVPSKRYYLPHITKFTLHSTIDALQNITPRDGFHIVTDPSSNMAALEEAIKKLLRREEAPFGMHKGYLRAVFNDVEKKARDVLYPMYNPIVHGCVFGNQGVLDGKARQMLEHQVTYLFTKAQVNKESLVELARYAQDNRWIQRYEEQSTIVTIWITGNVDSISFLKPDQITDDTYAGDTITKLEEVFFG